MESGWTETTILLGTLFLCGYLYAKWLYGYWERKKVPYLKPSFPVGNIEPIWNINKGYHQTMVDIYKEFKAKGYKYGGIFSSFRPVFIPVDPDILKSIMIKDFGYFVDRGMYFQEKVDPLSAHLFNIEGEKWRHLRTRLSPTFTSGKMKSMFELVIGCADGLEKEIEKLCRNKDPVDIKEMGALFTTNVIGTSAFGLDCNCFENPNNEFRIHTRTFFTGGLSRAVRDFVQRSFPSLCNKLGVRLFEKSVTDFFIRVIEDIVDSRESTKTKRSDFMQLLLDINKNAKNKGESFTFDEIAAQAFVFFLAGFETSSSTMTYAFYEMARHQEVQDKVREEINAVLEKHDGKITYESVLEMTYMSQVFDETLRQYPIVATLDRICTKDYKIPGEDIVLEKGTKIWIPLWGIQNDPENFPNPEKFDPDRFSPENKTNIHACAYMPFGEGPRICIGMRFGVMQAKIAMAVMLKDYKYTISPKMPKMEVNKKAPLLAPLGEVLLDIQKVN